MSDLAEKIQLLEVQNLSIGFQGERGYQSAVRGLSFKLDQGETLAIVGESGSGKSVSSLSLMSLLQKSTVRFESGSFILNQCVFSGLSELKAHISPNSELLESLRGKGIAMIFQEPMTALNPVMKCGEQITEVLKKHLALSNHEARARALELFKEVSLPRPEVMLDQYPHQLSGGQRQRVMIAMAISCNPKVLIADEPTTALDVTVQKSILVLLKDLQKRHNMGMIFITHDLGVVQEIADRILVMRRGELIEQGDAKEILSNPQTAYTKGLMACRPALGVKVDRLLTIEDFTSNAQPNVHSVKELKPAENAISNDVLIEVKGLVKKYEKQSLFGKKEPPVFAVQNVSFEIYKGETLGLVGESGCGKTTLSRMLLGLIPASEGSIIYNGRDLTKLSPSELRGIRKEIQIIFQDPYSALNPTQTVGEALMEPMEVYGLHGHTKGRKAKCIELLEKVGLNEAAMFKYPHEFSGGQRQRVVIARALAVEPSFVICDESVSALDVSVQAQVLNLLNDLKRDFGLTYLFISHDLGVVYHMSDRILVMNKGRIEELDKSEEVFYHPKSPYTQGLIDAVPGKTRSQI